MRVGVVGAGIAGLAAARALAERGCAVAVFEKSRGLGGRLATRRTRDGLEYDHGAPEVPDAQGPLAAYLAEAGAAGAAARHGGGWVGTPGMSALVGPLAQGLDIRHGATVAAVTPAGAGWAVDGEAFDAVVCAAPAPQTAALCAASGPVSAAARSAEMDPCWTLMAAWEAEVAAPAALTGPEAAPFEKLVAMAGRPGRAATPDRWVAHADLAWTRAHLELDKEAAAAALLAPLRAALGVGAPVHAVAHRWRYARVSRPVGQPCAQDGRLVACGDWLLGPDASDAYASGRAAAAALAAVIA
ncbi:NAD(P)/FAD-dependent oxidoreductase [Rubrimonas cliftonensis]|uniref:Amine oxidase domain-containing protein n=1 Tax=Rubrimonas cliftonensis TaxID=89524 RepID=A0A1H4DVX8_9RHOB|nr:FAD-dependent oxidoreductase [Rubrimonas cliftonensis]SEA76668.1 hypothetical protein SAMN05444370_11163 [Rubrimonas cliftonensis]